MLLYKGAATGTHDAVAELYLLTRSLAPLLGSVVLIQTEPVGRGAASLDFHSGTVLCGLCCSVGILLIPAVSPNNVAVLPAPVPTSAILIQLFALVPSEYSTSLLLILAAVMPCIANSLILATKLSNVPNAGLTEVPLIVNVGIVSAEPV